MIITVCSRDEMEKLARSPFEEKTAVISIVDADEKNVPFQYRPAYLLRLRFDDLYERPNTSTTEAEPAFSVFSKAQAQRIAEFVFQCKDEVDQIICQCGFGQSRSAAVAAAISEVLNGDGIRFFTDDRYGPNLYVFKMLYKELQKKNSLADV